MEEADSPTIDEEFETLPLEGSSSVVWNYFGFKASNGKFVEPEKKKRKEVFCRIRGCLKKVKYSGNTSNMHFHLKEHHPTIYCQIDECSQKRNTKESSSSRQPTSKQLILTQAFENCTQLKTTSPHWKALTEAVCYFIAKDMEPVSTVNNPGFCHMLKVFQPRYTPPDRKTLRQNYLPKLYEQERDRIKRQMSSIRFYSITTDIWSSRHQDSSA